MTERTGSGGTSLRHRSSDTKATDRPRDAEMIADAARGTEAERSDDRARRERRFERSQPMPADRHE